MFNQKVIFYATNRNIKKASFTLLAYHLQSAIAQSVWMSVVTQQLVIEFSKYSNFLHKKALWLPTKTKLAKYILIFILLFSDSAQFISLTVIYSLHRTFLKQCTQKDFLKRHPWRSTVTLRLCAICTLISQLRKALKLLQVLKQNRERRVRKCR